MANRWWTGSVGLAGVQNSTDSPPLKKPDLGISMNDTNVPGGDEEEERENSTDEPKEGAIEVGTTRRPRGRPPGSKNKPKPPIFVTRESPNALRSHVMEIANGADIADCVVQFARRRQRGVCVLSGSGTVINVTFRQPNAPGAVMALPGRFEILSLTGSFLPTPSPPGSSGLTIYLAGVQGQVVGGVVVGPLLASGPVLLMAATFSNATYDRLPIVDIEEEEQGQLTGGGGSPPIAGGSGGQQSGPGGSMGEGYSSIPAYNLQSNMLGNGAHLNHEAYNWNHGTTPGRSSY